MITFYKIVAYLMPAAPDRHIWHKCKPPFFSRRTVDGKRTELQGQTWRRRVGNRWEYKQDQMSFDDWVDL